MDFPRKNENLRDQMLSASLLSIFKPVKGLSQFDFNIGYSKTFRKLIRKPLRMLLQYNVYFSHLNS